MIRELKRKVAKICRLFLYGKTWQEKRTPDQILEHYQIERELADRLRKATKEGRRSLYSHVYDELYRRVPDHPQLTEKADSHLRAEKVSRQMKLLKRFIRPHVTFLELGAGDCSLSVEVARHVKRVYAIDVSREITKNTSFPQNLELIITDGCSVPVPKGSVDIAYSKDLVEHLHPEDAFDQFRNIVKALSCRGKYVCVTPNRLSGPHDISEYFDTRPSGFHLNEYTATELSQIFSKVGFLTTDTYVGGEGVYLRFPISAIKVCEDFLERLPFLLRKRISNVLLVRALLGIVIVGTK